MDKETLLRQLTIIDFMATDLGLYMNTHPNDSEALKIYNEVIAKGKEARNLYEAHHGPLVSYRCHNAEGWPWKDNPWPWNQEFNFKLDEIGEAH